MVVGELNYIDIHTHILPGIDDGAASLEETISMVSIAYKEGIRTIIATPHYGIMNPGFDIKKAEETFKMVQTSVKDKYPDMEIALGNEIFYTGTTMIDDLSKGTALTIAGTDYVLVEFSPFDHLRRIETGIRDLRHAGFRPILAHTERYEVLYKQPEIVEDLIDAGAVIQINCRSLIRGGLNKRTKFVRKLVKKDLVHIISSDCHNDNTRCPMMVKAAEKLHKWVDSETFSKIMTDNPKKILQNRFL